MILKFLNRKQSVDEHVNTIIDIVIIMGLQSLHQLQDFSNNNTKLLGKIIIFIT